MSDTASPIVAAPATGRSKVVRRIFGAATGYALARLQEGSTWRGIIGVLTGLGAAIEPTMAVKIITAGTLLAGAVGSLFGDKVPPAAE
jgi:hypothetical protein